MAPKLTEAAVKKMLKANCAEHLKKHGVSEDDVKGMKVAEMRVKLLEIAAEGGAKRTADEADVEDDKPAKKAKKQDQPEVPGLVEAGAKLDMDVLGDHHEAGHKVIVFFYPKASTPGCTAEACSLRDHHKALQAKGYNVIGVSACSEKAQANFKTKQKLPFPLIPDTEHEVLKAFGVWGPKTTFGKKTVGIRRSTFVVDEDGVVTQVFSKVQTKTHGEQLLECL